MNGFWKSVASRFGRNKGLTFPMTILINRQTAERDRAPWKIAVPLVLNINPLEDIRSAKGNASLEKAGSSGQGGNGQ
jgi:hypothetical protein